MDGADDADWVRRHLAGDPDAFRPLYEKYGEKVFATAYRILGEENAAADLVRKGEGSLVASVFSDDREFVRRLVVAVGPWHGRLYLGSEHMAGQSPGPGTVLPGTVHGGPGRAGGGEELGVFRGMALDASLIVGYAFDQRFSTGWDVRDTDGLANLSDEPYIGIIVRGIF